MNLSSLVLVYSSICCIVNILKTAVTLKQQLSSTYVNNLRYLMFAVIIIF